MLIELSVGNYRSFRNKTTLSMIASKEQKFRKRLPKIEKRYQLTITPVAAIFGANASGKSNLVRALQDLSRLLLEPPRPGQPLPHRPFKLDPECRDSPTHLEVLFSWEDQIFEYSIDYDRHIIVEEKLVRHLSRTEKVLFERHDSAITLGDPIKSDKLVTHLEGVPENVPVVAFLGSMNKESIPHWDLLTAPHQWIRLVLTLPAGIFDPMFRSGSFDLQPQVPIPDEVLESIDLGVCGIDRESVDFSSLRLSEESEDYLRKTAEDHRTMVIEVPSGRYEIRSNREGILTAERIRLLHQGTHETYALEWNEESDGTKSVIRLLGVFVTLAFRKSPLLLIVDELDRSFHTELSRALIDGFLATCSPDSRAQLLFTTHDLLLMDPDRLRRDEMWVTEKNRSGSSTLIGISEYRGVRKDADLRKSYLVGRFGGVPSIEPLNLSRWAKLLSEVDNG